MASRKSDPFWYARHYKDYMQDTSHLSIIEHGAYTLLLDLYYMTGKPLVANGIALARQLRCTSDEEKEVMQKVLEEFFFLENGLWHNKRADQEIDERRKVIEKRKISSKIGNTKRWGNSPICDPMWDAKCDPKLDPICSPIVDPDTDTDTQDSIYTSISTKKQQERPPYEEIAGLYNETLPELSSCKLITDKRKAHINAAIKQFPEAIDVEFWRKYFEHVSTCPFLMGEKADWQASFDFLINRNNMLKVREGKYDAK